MQIGDKVRVIDKDCLDGSSGCTDLCNCLNNTAIIESACFNNVINTYYYTLKFSNDFKCILPENEIEKIPFRPQKGDNYYTIVNKGEVVISVWVDRSIDYARLIAGIVLRTREEAEDYLTTWLDRISKL